MKTFRIHATYETTVEAKDEEDAIDVFHRENISTTGIDTGSMDVEAEECDDDY